MSDLTICKLSDCSASVAGGKEIILLCEKVAKEDIQIRFYEERDGEVYWEALGDFQPTQVHKQVAISFRTPKYKNIDVEKPVKVWVQLRRPSDGAVSESVPFQFVPLDSGRATFWSLRRALSKKGDYNTFSKILNESAYLTPEMQKRKLDPGSPMMVDELSEGKKPMLDSTLFDSKRDSLISGGNLVLVPNSERHEHKNSSNLPRNTNEEDTNDSTIIGTSQSIKIKETVNNQVDDRVGDNVFDKSMEGVFVPGNENQFREVIKQAKEAADTNENSQSFNDLISQVAELDEIYAETQERLLLANTALESHLEDISMDCQETFRDNQTYSSLQMAMKNPVEPLEHRAYEDVPIIQGPLIDISKSRIPRKAETTEEKLPPLPPKRVKKTPPRRPDESPLTKDLPKTPENTKTKQNIFQRLFSKNKTPNPGKMKTSQSSESLKYPPSSAPTSPTFGESKSNCDLKEIKNSNKWLHRGSTGSALGDSQIASARLDSSFKENFIEKELLKTEKELEGYLANKEDLELGLDLTEAENYALYTSLAPHASMTELDEISFYYSPVEKGKILSQEEVHLRLKEVELKNIVRPQNVT